MNLNGWMVGSRNAAFRAPEGTEGPGAAAGDAPAADAPGSVVLDFLSAARGADDGSGDGTGASPAAEDPVDMFLRGIAPEAPPPANQNPAPIAQRADAGPDIGALVAAEVDRRIAAMGLGQRAPAPPAGDPAQDDPNAPVTDEAVRILRTQVTPVVSALQKEVARLTAERASDLRAREVESDHAFIAEHVGTEVPKRAAGLPADVQLAVQRGVHRDLLRAHKAGELKSYADVRRVTDESFTDRMDIARGTGEHVKKLSAGVRTDAKAHTIAPPAASAPPVKVTESDIAKRMYGTDDPRRLSLSQARAVARVASGR